MNNTTIAIDIAKSSFHAVKLHQSNVQTDKAFTRKALKMWLAKQKPSHVVIEACGSSHSHARGRYIPFSRRGLKERIHPGPEFATQQEPEYTLAIFSNHYSKNT